MGDNYQDIDTVVFIIGGSSRNLLGIKEIKRLNLLDVVNNTCVNECDHFIDRCIEGGDAHIEHRKNINSNGSQMSF